MEFSVFVFNFILFYEPKKYIFALFNFLLMVIFTQDIFSTWTSVVQLDVQNINVVSTLYYIVNITLNRRGWFDVVPRCKFQGWHKQRCYNVDLTLSNVATSYQPNNNAETTLKSLLGNWFTIRNLLIEEILSPTIFNTERTFIALKNPLRF